MDVFTAAREFERRGWTLNQARAVPGRGESAALTCPKGYAWSIRRDEDADGFTVDAADLGGLWLTVPGLSLSQVEAVAEANR